MKLRYPNYLSIAILPQAVSPIGPPNHYLAIWRQLLIASCKTNPRHAAASAQREMRRSTNGHLFRKAGQMLAPSAIAFCLSPIINPLRATPSFSPNGGVRFFSPRSFVLGIATLVDRHGTICITWAMANSVQEPLIVFQGAVTETWESVASARQWQINQDVKARSFSASLFPRCSSLISSIITTFNEKEGRGVVAQWK